MLSKSSSMVLGLSLASTFFLSMNPSAVYADDTKIYPGIMCHKNPGNGATPGFWAGGIVNDHETWALNVSCPVIKDKLSSLQISGVVRVRDQSFAKNITCTFVSAHLNPSGHHTLATSPTLTSSGVLPQEDLEFDQVAGVYLPDSHFEFSCSIPPEEDGRRSMISSYSVTEITGLIDD